MVRRLQILVLVVLAVLVVASPRAEAVTGIAPSLVDLPTPRAVRAGSDLGEPLPLRDVEALPINDLRLLTEYHPETDRWTERNNRVRIEPYVGGWFFSGELDVDAANVYGVVIGWEVPGFIAIRWDSSIAPFARLSVKMPSAGTQGYSARRCEGYVHAHFLSVGIFNPELSDSNLAFWAGLGIGLFVFDFNENGVNTFNNTEQDVRSNQYAWAGQLFAELDYKVNDVFHIGVGMRFYVLNATFTDDGHWYDINGVDQGGSGRNDGMMDDVASVTEITLNFSLVL